MAETPLLILMDCQQEQLLAAGGGAEEQGAELVRRLERLLRNARYAGWSVAHCQLRQPGGYETLSQLSAPIDRLRPAGREPVFLRHAFSAYTDRCFGRLVREHDGQNIYLAGFSAPYSILSTAFDAAERGDRLTVIQDAIGGPAIGMRSAESVLDLSIGVIGRLINVVNGEDVLEDWPHTPMPAAMTGTGLRP